MIQYLNIYLILLLSILHPFLEFKYLSNDSEVKVIPLNLLSDEYDLDIQSKPGSAAQCDGL